MKLRIVLLMALLTPLSGCSNPIPPEKSDYVGQWRSKEMTLLILADGTVDYQRYKNGGAVTVNGPLQEFDGDDFSVGIGFLSTTFEVSQPPAMVEGRWQMVVDGVRLTRAGGVE